MSSTTRRSVPPRQQHVHGPNDRQRRLSRGPEQQRLGHGQRQRDQSGTLQLELNGINVANPLTISGNGVGGTRGALGQYANYTSTYSGPVTLAGNSSVYVNQGTMTVSGNIGELNSGTVLTKIGTARCVLSGTNTYSGGTQVSAGILQFNASSAIPSTGLITVNSGGVAAVGGAYGTGGMLDQAFLGMVATSSSGVVAMATSDTNNLDFNASGLSGVSLGSVGNNTYSGVITPGANGCLLGGGAGLLSISGSLGGASTNVQYNGNVALIGSNSNSYGGATVVNNGSVYLNMAGGTVAVPSGGTVQMGGGNAAQPNLRMQQSNQFGPGVVMTFANTSGNWARFDLAATSQTLAGLIAGNISTQGAQVVQNVGLDGLGSGTGTLTLNGAGSYLYNGYLRNQDNSGHTNLLSLVMAGAGEQSLVGNNITYSGNTTVTSGTLQFYNARNFSNGNVPSNTLTIAGGAVLEFYTDNATSTTDNANQVLGSTQAGGTTITGAGIFRKTGNGILASGQGSAGQYLTMAMSAGGLIDIEGGTFRNGGWQDTTWTNNLASMYIAAGAAFDLWDGNTVYINALNGPGTVTKQQGNGGTVNLTLGVNNGSGTSAGRSRIPTPLSP